jgi:uncharacterized protein involved in exopolysaccharide biosynthesis
VLLGDTYRSLRRHAWLIVFGTLACVFVAGLLTARRHVTYEATSVVRIMPVGTADANARFEAAQHLTNTYANIYTRGAVVAQMNAMLGGRVRITRNALEAHEVKDLDLLSVGARDRDPRRAALIAEAGVRALEALSSTERLRVISPAVPPREPASSRTGLNLALAFVLGLILSAGLALLLDALRQPVPDAAAIERDVGVPVLARVPMLRFARATLRAMPHAEEAVSVRQGMKRARAGRLKRGAP